MFVKPWELHDWSVSQKLAPGSEIPWVSFPCAGETGRGRYRKTKGDKRVGTPSSTSRTLTSGQENGRWGLEIELITQDP